MRCLLVILGLLCAGSLVAQDTVIVRGQDAPPPGFPVEVWAVEFFNRPTTTRIVGTRLIDADEIVSGDVAVLDGPLVVEGEIVGTLVAINADVTIRADARIDGNVLVLGGDLIDDIDAQIAGTLRRHAARVDVTLREGLLILNSVPTTRRTRLRPRFRSYGGSSILIGIGHTYNRVEGLPLRLGLRLVWGSGDFESRLRGYGVFRTAGDFKTNRQDMGYHADWSFRYGRRRTVTVTARAFDLAVPTQPWPLEIHEVGWASFLWHRDYRDYLLQRGFDAKVAIVPFDDLTLEGAYTRVEENTVAARDPWTPFRNSEVWRPNPAIDEGDFDLFRGAVTYDTRPSRHSSRSGWYVHGEWEHGTGTNLNERLLPTSIRPALPAVDYAFDRGSVDLRRYQGIGRRGQLRLRGMWSGRIAGGPLPVQRRYSLGGPDPMNGYAFRAFGCGVVGDGAVTGLCDHVLLFQAEFRGSLDFDWFDGGRDYIGGSLRGDELLQDFDEFDWLDEIWFDGPTFVLFSDAGTGWLEGSDVGALNFDIGAGVEFGSVGIYVAKAIEEGEPIRATLRIARRF